MRINRIQAVFKGYDAAPLKNIYKNKLICDDFDEELESICAKENITCKKVPSDESWIQDNSIVTEKNGEPYIVGELGIKNGIFDALPLYIEGGNTFIGKFDNGQKWMMIGVEENDKELSSSTRKSISKVYNIPKENIFGIPKPDFHLDLGIRPIGFPDVLVNDPDMAEDEVNKMDDGSGEYRKFKNKFDKFKREASNLYAPCDKICSALKDKGFNPIRVAGVFYDGVNFMNGIVNKHSDGKISYITNSSACKNHIYNKLQENFENELREKIPKIADIYFIKGNENCILNRLMEDTYSTDLDKSNYMMNTLRYYEGGLHCLTLEEPNFKEWA